MHTGALSVDIDASGSFRGSLNGLEIAISLCDSEKHVIFLFFTILTMFWCFPWLGIADKSCSKHIPSTLDVNRSVSTHIWLLWDVFFVFIGAFGSEFAHICDWLWEQRDFLVFHDFDDVLVFSRAGCG